VHSPSTCKASRQRASIGRSVRRWVSVGVVPFMAAAAGLAACDRDRSITPPDVACSESTYQRFEAYAPTGDGRGHGPDVGSDEWKSVIEFRLGIRGVPGVPSRDDEAWCRFVDGIVRVVRGPVPESRPAEHGTGAIGPVRFVCNGDPGDEVFVTFVRSAPPSSVVERGGHVSVMVQQPSASGTRYEGRHTRFWEHQGEATIVWGEGAEAMRCVKDAPGKQQPKRYDAP
jgi:hypothetical protein